MLVVCRWHAEGASAHHFKQVHAVSRFCRMCLKCNIKSLPQEVDLTFSYYIKLVPICMPTVSKDEAVGMQCMDSRIVFCV